MTVAEFIKKVEDGEPYRINFEKREVRLNGFLVDIDFELPDNVEEKLLELFRNYMYSVPSAKADSKYFFAYDEAWDGTQDEIEIIGEAKDFLIKEIEGWCEDYKHCTPMELIEQE